MSKITLRNSKTGQVKTAPVGFSWTTFLFGPFPAMMRGDILMAVLMIVIFCVTAWLGTFIMAFLYNKIYLDSLIKQGYRPIGTTGGLNMTDVGYSNDIVHEEQIRCPECREFIIKGARKCKHCGSQLTTE